MPSFLLGIDLGQMNDPTALVLLEHDDEPKPIYRLRALHRFPLGTAYTALPQLITKRLKCPPLLGRTRVALDATGVGAPIVELFAPHLPPASLYAITITGGNTITGRAHKPHVPKLELISAAVVVLEQRRLRVATALAAATALTDELLAFRRTRSESGHETYGAAGNAHDDLVLALSLAIWIGENKPRPRPSKITVPRGRIPLHHQRNTFW